MIFENLSPHKAQALMDKIGGMDGLEKLLAGEWVLSTARDGVTVPGDLVDDLLETVGEPVRVPAGGRFVARDSFVEGHSGGLPISLLGEDFQEHFLGLVEEDTREVSLCQRVLVKSSTDAPIFQALGGRESARVSPAHVHAFLQRADRSKWFFFYVADVRGTLWAVDTYWRDGGWDLEAYSVTYPRGWRAGGHVVSR